MKGILFALFAGLLKVVLGQNAGTDSLKGVEATTVEVVVEGNQLEYRNGLWCFEEKPFTGLFISRYRNGQIKIKANYKDGKGHGLRSTWYENGQKKEDSNWKDGKIWSAFQWKPNGEKCPETNVIDGNGIQVFYNENGGKVVEENLKDGKWHGLRSTWYENGQKKEELKFKEGRIISTRRWDENGKTIYQSRPTGIAGLRKMAEAGRSKSQFELGVAYAQGNGVAKNEHEAFMWFSKAAEKGLPEAQHNLGLLCVESKKSKMLNVRLAEIDQEIKTLERVLLDKPALKPIMKAQIAPRKLEKSELEKQLAEVDYKNDTVAVKCFRQAAEQGYHPSQFALGAMHLKGQGVPKKKVVACAWFVISAYYGNEKAKAAIESLSRSLQPEQVVEMQKLSKELFKQIEANKNDYHPPNP